MRDGRLNGYAADWCERSAATRYRLERVDENVCDAYTTEDTPVRMLGAGVPVEVKGCARSIDNGHGRGMKGRFTFHVGTFEELVERGGEVALVVYEEVDDSILIRRCGLVPASVVEDLLSPTGRSYTKLSWGDVYRDLEEPYRRETTTTDKKR
jgi:hypothetical protein